MPRTNRPPSYRLHKARNLAVVTINGTDVYLGRYGSPESHEKYARLIAEWNANGRKLPSTSPVPAQANENNLTVNGLILRYWTFVKGYYRKNGELTGEVDNIRLALRPLRTLFGSTCAA